MALSTFCPQCLSTFHIAGDALKQAKGQVKCGGCGHQFLALLNIQVVNAPIASPLAKEPNVIKSPWERTWLIFGMAITTLMVLTIGYLALMPQKSITTYVWQGQIRSMFKMPPHKVSPTKIFTFEHTSLTRKGNEPLTLVFNVRNLSTSASAWPIIEVDLQNQDGKVIRTLSKYLNEWLATKEPWMNPKSSWTVNATIDEKYVSEVSKYELRIR